MMIIEITSPLMRKGLMAGSLLSSLLDTIDHVSRPSVKEAARDGFAMDNPYDDIDNDFTLHPRGLGISIILLKSMQRR